MNKNTLNFATITGIILTLFILNSCSKEKQEFSCNKKVDSWVKTYKTEVGELSRKQLVTLPPSYQKAIFTSLSKEKKYDLYLEKLNILLKTEYNTKYKNKIKELLDFISPEIYDHRVDEKPKDYVISFLNKWENDVLTKFETDTLMYSIKFCTLMTKKEFDFYLDNYSKIDYSWLKGGDKILRPTLRPGGGGLGSDCTCSYSIYCSILLTVTCEDGLNSCRVVWNCGLVGTSKCTGQCDSAESVEPPQP